MQNSLAGMRERGKSPELVKVLIKFVIKNNIHQDPWKSLHYESILVDDLNNSILA